MLDLKETEKSVEENNQPESNHSFLRSLITVHHTLNLLNRKVIGWLVVFMLVGSDRRHQFDTDSSVLVLGF